MRIVVLRYLLRVARGARNKLMDLVLATVSEPLHRVAVPKVRVLVRLTVLPKLELTAPAPRLEAVLAAPYFLHRTVPHVLSCSMLWAPATHMGLRENFPLASASAQTL